jgi:hypothetical protein
MFLGYRVMFIGLRKSLGKLRAKGYVSISIIFQRPRFIAHRKTLNVIPNSYSSSNKLLLSHINTSAESSPNGVPEVLILFNLYKYNPGEFLKRFHARRTRDRSRKRRSSALLVELVESMVKEKFYKKTINIDME